MAKNQALMTVEDEIINDENTSTARVSEPRIFPGDLLRTAREVKGYTTQEVATYLCLRRQLVEEIEASKFDPKVAATFIRGYLKSFAKYVGASETDVLNAYDDLALGKPRVDDMQSFSRKKAIEKQDSRLMLITYIIVAVLVASFVLFLWQQSGDEEESGTNSQQSSMAAAHSTDKPTVDTATVAENSIPMKERERAEEEQPVPQLNEQVMVEAAEPSSTESPTEINTAAESTVDEPENIPVVEVPEPAPQSTSNNIAVNRTGTFLDEADPTAGDLVLYFRDNSWVEVKDFADNDKVFAVGIKNKGYNMPLGGADAYSVTLGAPNAVEIYYQGQRVDLSEVPRNRIVPFRVPNLQP